MNIFKKASILGISISIILGSSINVFAQSFDDLDKDNWAYESVQWGVDEGLVVGYKEGGKTYYRPTFQVTEEEFVAVLTRYLRKNLVAQEGEHWSQPSYDWLEYYSLPIKGYKDKNLKRTGLTRGQIAMIIAAKNGFNLDEKQAVYYMYENDLSSGLVDDKMTFDSYGRNDVVTRAQVPAFFKKLEEKGHTTFMGEPSPITVGNGIKGVTGIPKNPMVITKEMFEKLTPTKGEVIPTAPTTGDL